MPKTPRTPSSRRQKKQTDSVTSPYFRPNATVSPSFSGKSGDVKDSDILCPDELDKDGFTPYNSYWGALARAAHSKPTLIQGIHVKFGQFF